MQNERQNYNVLRGIALKILSIYYNLGHNISELYNVLIHIRLTTSKMERDILYSKLGELPHELPNNLRVNFGSSYPTAFSPMGGLNAHTRKKKKKFGSSQSSFEKLNFGNSSQETRKNRYQTFLGLSSFTDLPYYLPNVLPRIVPNINLNKEILTKYLLCLKNLYC